MRRRSRISSTRAYCQRLLSRVGPDKLPRPRTTRRVGVVWVRISESVRQRRDFRREADRSDIVRTRSAMDMEAGGGEGINRVLDKLVSSEGRWRGVRPLPMMSDQPFALTRIWFLRRGTKDKGDILVFFE